MLPADGHSVSGAYVSSADAEICKEEESCPRWIIRNSIDVECAVASSRFDTKSELLRLVQSCNIELLSHKQLLCRLLWYHLVVCMYKDIAYITHAVIANSNVHLCPSVRG